MNFHLFLSKTSKHYVGLQKTRNCKVWLTFIAAFALSWSLTADVKMPKIFSDNMVLQRDMPVPVWGWADKNEKVTVSFKGQEKTATAGEDGKWMVKLDPLKASKESSELIVTSSIDIRQMKIKNVLVGEVWVCSGQSNMNCPLRDVLNSKDEIESSTQPLIRHIKLQPEWSPTKRDDIVGAPWVTASPYTTATHFSAVGYFFARDIVKELDVPVGLIGSNHGGTAIEPWTPLEGYRQVAELKDFLRQVEEWDSSTEAGRAKYLEYLEKLKEWIPRAEKACADKQGISEPPTPPQPPANIQPPQKLFNGMISPLIPYAIRGVIWYQGESNPGIGYLPRMKALIGGWRQLWQQGDFPFYFVQLASYRASDPNHPEGGDGFAAVREAQFQSLDIANVGMAVTIDIGDAANIHPPNKQDVGRRLALWALAKDYPSTTLRAGGKAADLVYSGPLYKNFKVEGNKIRIAFDHADSGLFIGKKEGLEPPKEIKEGKLGWISSAGADKKFYFADAMIDGQTLVVSSDKVPNPVAVRYHFTANPDGLHLYNREGLPASPFRTENW